VSDHLGDRVAALVDGELDHATRDRVLVHLAHCDPCRAQVEAHRRLKHSLGALRSAPPVPSGDLVARLMAVPAGRPVPTGRPHTPRGPRRPAGPRGPLGRAARRPRRAAAAGALLVVGLASALALGGTSTAGPRAPVDPASPAFVGYYAVTTSEVPLTEPAAATLVPAGLAGTDR
jgi:anti-sigma factor RsiW